MTTQYFIRAKHYKKPITGEVIEYNGRAYGICKNKGEWIITDILTGLKMNNYKVDTRTKQKAIDYIRNLDITQHEKTLKDAEIIFNSLPEYDFNKVYISEKEERNQTTCFYRGEYNSKQFETTISVGRIGCEVDYFEGDFTEEEEEEIIKQIA